MLTIRNASEEDLFYILSLGNSSLFENIDLQSILENTMVAYEGNVPLAAAAYEVFGSIGILCFVMVHKEHQREYLGDGIVKALLNLADRRGIRLMLVDAHDCTDFFRKVGFEELKEDYKNDMKIHEVVENCMNPQHTLFVAKLPDFFLKACRSNK